MVTNIFIGAFRYNAHVQKCTIVYNSDKCVSTFGNSLNIILSLHQDVYMTNKKIIHIIKMKNLKSVREQLGLSQSELAEFFKISRSVVAMTEKGKRNLDTPTLIKMSKVENFINQSIHIHNSHTVAPGTEEALNTSREELLNAQHMNHVQMWSLRIRLDNLQKKKQQHLLLKDVVNYFQQQEFTEDFSLSRIGLNNKEPADPEPLEKQMAVLEMRKKNIESALEKLDNIQL